MFNLEVVRLLTIPAQAIIVCFCFMNLVMVATYTANLAAVLTTSVSSSGYQTVSDLQGTTVGAHGPYQARLAANENLNTITITWNGPSTFVNVSSFITSGGISAYIFDYPILLYWKNFYDTACKLTFLPEIEPFDYGIMFNKAFPISIQQEFNIGILTAQSSAKLAQLESKYVTVNSLCAAPSSSTTGLTGLVFYQVSGLWIIMGCAVGVGILVSIYRIVQIHCFGAEVAEYGYSEDGAGVTRRPLSFSPGTFKMTHLADAANDMASRRVWRGDSNGYDPETVGLEQNGSGPPQSSTDMEIDQATCSQPPSQIAITATAVGATAAITSQKTLSGPPGTQERSSNMAGAFRSSFARMSNAARDLAGKVLVDPNAPVRPPVGDFSVKSGRRSSRFEALPSKPSETGNPSLSPFDEADSEQDTSLGPLQVGAIGSASQRRSNPLPKVASPLGQQSSKATDALNSVDSISIPLPPVLPAPAPASAASPSPSPSLRRNEEGTGVPSLHHSRSTGRVNDFYRPKTAAAEQPRLLVNKTLEQQMADRSFRGGSPRPQN